MIVPAGGFMFMAKMPNSTANSASWKMQSGHVLCSAGPTVWHKLGHCHYCEVSILRCWLARFLQGHKKLFIVFLIFCFVIGVICCYWCFWLPWSFNLNKNPPAALRSWISYLCFVKQFLCMCTQSTVYSMPSAAAAPLHRLWHSSGHQNRTPCTAGRIAAEDRVFFESLPQNRLWDLLGLGMLQICTFLEFPGTFLQSTTFG